MTQPLPPSPDPCHAWGPSHRRRNTNTNTNTHTNNIAYLKHWVKKSFNAHLPPPAAAAAAAPGQRVRVTRRPRQRLGLRCADATGAAPSCCGRGPRGQHEQSFEREPARGRPGEHQQARSLCDGVRGRRRRRAAGRLSLLPAGARGAARGPPCPSALRIRLWTTAELPFRFAHNVGTAVNSGYGSLLFHF